MADESMDSTDRLAVLEHRVARQRDTIEKTFQFLDDLLTTLDRTAMGIQRHEAIELKARLAKVRRALD